MQLSKIYKYSPVRQFILNAKEAAGVKVACVCERAIVRAKYRNLTKGDFTTQQKYMLDADEFDFNHRNNCVIERERLYRLATVYYTEINGVRTALDIHYHIQGTENGYRSTEQVKIDTLKILENAGFVKNLVIGGYERKRKHSGRNTSRIRRHTKAYTKVE